MTARRIRCECGRVYEPAKHEKCPSCGATAHAATVEPPRSEEEESLVRQDDRVLSDDTKPLPINPRMLAIAGAILLVVLIALALFLRRTPSASDTRKDESTPQPTQAAPTPTATIAPTATVAPTTTAAPTATTQPTAPTIPSATPPPNYGIPQAFDLPGAIAAAAPGAT